MALTLIKEDGTGMVSSSIVPKAGVRQAACELARELLIVDRTTAPAGEGITTTWTDTGGTKYSKSDRRPVLSRLTQSLLARYGEYVRRNSAAVRLVRA